MDKVKKGVRVIYDGMNAKILLVNYRSPLNTKILIYESQSTHWVNKGDLTLDRQFYRNKKLNKIL